MKNFIFAKEPSEAHKDAIVRIEEHFADICSHGQINFRVLDKSKTWKEWNMLGHIFFERPEILAEAREIFVYLVNTWTNSSGIYREEPMLNWLKNHAEEIEEDADYDDVIDGQAFGFYLDTDLAMYAIVVDMSDTHTFCPELAIFAKDKRYLCDQYTARKHLEEASKNCGDIAYAREACYYLLAQLSDKEEKTKRKLESTINKLNSILRG